MAKEFNAIELARVHGVSDFIVLNSIALNTNLTIDLCGKSKATNSFAATWLARILAFIVPLAIITEADCAHCSLTFNPYE